MVERKLTLKYAALQGVYWMLAAVAMAYSTPLLEAKGFNSLEIGLLNAVKYTSVIVFQVLIASFSDKYAKIVPIKYIVAVLTFVSIASAYIFWVKETSFLGTAIILMLFGATINCISPLIDSLSIQYMNHGRMLNYTLSRACGSGTYAVFCVLTGVFADMVGVRHILLLQIAIAFLFFICNLLMDKVNFDEKTKQDSAKENAGKNVTDGITETPENQVHNAWYLLSHFPKYLYFLLGCMLIFMGYGMNATFLIDVVTERGGNHTDYGIAIFVLSVAEIPVALFFMKMKRRISVDKMMVICAVFCTLRAAATTFAPTILLVILSQCLELFGLSIFYAGSVYFVMENLPETDVVKGVSLINVATVGVGEATAAALCGVIKEAFGLRILMVTSIFVSLLSVFVMFVMLRAKKYRK